MNDNSLPFNYNTRSTRKNKSDFLIDYIFKKQEVKKPKILVKLGSASSNNNVRRLINISEDEKNVTIKDIPISHRINLIKNNFKYNKPIKLNNNTNNISYSSIDDNSKINKPKIRIDSNSKLKFSKIFNVNNNSISQLSPLKKQSNNKSCDKSNINIYEFNIDKFVNYNKVTNKLKNQSYYDNVENLEDLHFNSVNFYQYNKKLSTKFDKVNM